MTKILLFLSLFMTNTFAYEGAFLKYGLGVFAPESHSVADIKLISLGLSKEIFILDHKLELGGWADNRKAGGKNGAFGAWSLGLDPQVGTFYLNWYTGLALISTTDALLGSHFQFMHDLGFGIGDRRKVRVGFHYKHLSNAGIVQPNRGRDFAGIQLQVPW